MPVEPHADLYIPLARTCPFDAEGSHHPSRRQDVDFQEDLIAGRFIYCGCEAEESLKGRGRATYRKPRLLGCRYKASPGRHESRYISAPATVLCRLVLPLDPICPTSLTRDFKIDGALVNNGEKAISYHLLPEDIEHNLSLPGYLHRLPLCLLIGFDKNRVAPRGKFTKEPGTI
jgi:hypothetical protein